MSENKPNIINNIMEVLERRGTIYPEEFKAGFDGRVKRSLSNAVGLTQFGVNHVVIEPGCISSQRHWHLNEDEFVLVVDGEVILETNAGETVLTPGMAVGFPAGKPDGHRIINKSDKPAILFEVGTRSVDEEVTYPDIDMLAKREDGVTKFTRKDGTPYK